jgi:hypothetical protein
MPRAKPYRPTRKPRKVRHEELSDKNKTAICNILAVRDPDQRETLWRDVARAIIMYRERAGSAHPTAAELLAELRLLRGAVTKFVEEVNEATALLWWSVNREPAYAGELARPAQRFLALLDFAMRAQSKRRLSPHAVDSLAYELLEIFNSHDAKGLRITSRGKERGAHWLWQELHFAKGLRIRGSARAKRRFHRFCVFVFKAAGLRPYAERRNFYYRFIKRIGVVHW